MIARRTVGVTGSRMIETRAQQRAIRDAVDALPDGALVVTGACIGVDAEVARVAYRSGRLYVCAIVPARRNLVDPSWMRTCHSYEELPAGSSYRQRNERIVTYSTDLLAFPMYRESDERSRRSGTWMTIRMARRAVKTVAVVVLDDVE